MEGMQSNPAQIKKFLKQLTKSREQYLGYLGQLAYQEYQAGNLAVAKLQEVCATIDGINAQVSKCEQDLAAIEQMKMIAKYPRCVYCGNPYPPGSANCAACGQPTTPPVYQQPPAYQQAPAPAYAPAPPAAPAAPAAGPACASCGAPLQADAAFCTGCGKPATPVAAAPAAPPEAPPAPAEPEAPAEQAAAEEPAPEPAAPEAPAPEASAPEAAPETPAQEPEAAPTAEPEEPAGAPGTLACPNCGVVYDDPEALFCTECGSKMR